MRQNINIDTKTCRFFIVTMSNKNWYKTITLYLQLGATLRLINSCQSFNCLTCNRIKFLKNKRIKDRTATKNQYFCSKLSRV